MHVRERAKCQQRDLLRMLTHQFDEQFDGVVRLVKFCDGDGRFSQTVAAREQGWINEPRNQFTSRQRDFCVRGSQARPLRWIDQLDDRLQVSRGGRTGDTSRSCGDGEQIDIGIEQRQRDREGVSNSRIGVDDQFAGQGSHPQKNRRPA